MEVVAVVVGAVRGWLEVVGLVAATLVVDWAVMGWVVEMEA